MTKPATKLVQLPLPPDLHRALKIRAASQSTTLRALLISTLRRELTRPGEPAGQERPR